MLSYWTIYHTHSAYFGSNGKILLTNFFLPSQLYSIEEVTTASVALGWSLG